VNPVLREGNSDRRCAIPVKKHSQSIKDRNPALQKWESGNTSSVNAMTEGDFYSAEQSYIMPAAGSVTISLHAENGEKIALKDV
jgi:isocitrate dehydrogenase